MPFSIDQPLVGRHALVVPRHARQRAFLRAIGLHVHERRPVLELADQLLGRRDEARAGVVGLLADRAIELGGMADRLVNRQPQVRRLEDQIVLARLDALRRSFSAAIDAHRSALPGMSSDST